MCVCICVREGGCTPANPSCEATASTGLQATVYAALNPGLALASCSLLQYTRLCSVLTTCVASLIACSTPSLVAGQALAPAQARAQTTPPAPPRPANPAAAAATTAATGAVARAGAAAAGAAGARTGRGVAAAGKLQLLAARGWHRIPNWCLVLSRRRSRSFPWCSFRVRGPQGGGGLQCVGSSTQFW